MWLHTLIWAYLSILVPPNSTISPESNRVLNQRCRGWFSGTCLHVWFQVIELVVATARAEVELPASHVRNNSAEAADAARGPVRQEIGETVPEAPITSISLPQLLPTTAIDIDRSYASSFRLRQFEKQSSTHTSMHSRSLGQRRTTLCWYANLDGIMPQYG